MFKHGDISRPLPVSGHGCTGLFDLPKIQGTSEREQPEETWGVRFFGNRQGDTLSRFMHGRQCDAVVPWASCIAAGLKKCNEKLPRCKWSRQFPFDVGIRE
jgi:hypothetical protein